MSQTTTFALPSPSPMFAPLVQRWLAFRRTGPQASDRRHHTGETAASLYARAARYEASQPGFASDLRAAAEAMDGTAAHAAR